MLFYTFNGKKVYVSEAEVKGVQTRLAAGAQLETLSEREKHITTEMARRVAISTCAGKMKNNAIKVRDAALTDLRQARLTPEDFQNETNRLWDEFNAEIARIEEAKVA
jgi:hypothetical protein